MTVTAQHVVRHAVSLSRRPEFAGRIGSLCRRYRRWRDLKQARAALMKMVYLDDRILDDIGVTREEVLWAASLPLERNAALVLRQIAGERPARAAATASS